MLSFIQLLIMALTALNTAHCRLGNRFALFYKIMDLYHFLIISVAFKVNIGTLVALYTPFHGQRRILVNLFHGFNRAVTCLTF